MVYFKKTAMLSEIRPDLRTTQLAELIHDCVHKKVFTLEALNEKITGYRDRRQAGDRYKLVPVHQSVLKSTEQRQPEKNASLRMTGAQVKEFALCSLEILRPLMERRKSLPSWKSWQIMHVIVQLIDKKSMGVKDVEQLPARQGHPCARHVVQGRVAEQVASQAALPRALTP